MPKPPAEPQPVHDDGSPILPPPSTGAQSPTVAADVAPLEATHDADGHELDADGQPIIPDPEPVVVPADPSGNPEAQADNALGDVEAVPEVIGYCLNPECVVATVQLWKPLDVAPVMCQCGQMLADAPADPAEVVVEDAPPA
jgi:hypothetical protein